MANWRHSWKAWALIAAAAVIAVGSFLIADGAFTSRTPPSLPVKAPAVTPKASASPSASPPAAAGIARSVPVSLTIPGIGTGGCSPGVSNATVVPEGTTDGALDVPPLSGSAAYDVGWWDGGHTPGQDGPAVLVSHVNSAAMGNLTFACLSQMSKGMTAIITLADGAKVTFTVYATQEVLKTAFPTDAVYGMTSDPELRLITCGGTFDSSTGHYTDNLVIYLKETAVTG